MNANSQPTPYVDKFSRSLEAVVRRIAGPWLPTPSKPLREIVMEDQELHRMDFPEGVSEIRCTQGVLWVTQTGDDRDHLLEPGGSFSPQPEGLVLVQALGPAVMRWH